MLGKALPQGDGLHPFEIVVQTVGGDLYALGLAGAAGGENHIKHVVPLRQGRGKGFGGRGQSQQLPGAKDVFAADRRLFQRQQQLCPGDLQNVPQPLVRHGGIHRTVGVPGPDTAEKGRQHQRGLVTVDHHETPVVRQQGTHPGGDAAGALHQRPVAQGRSGAEILKRGALRGVLRGLKDSVEKLHLAFLSPAPIRSRELWFFRPAPAGTDPRR